MTSRVHRSPAGLAAWLLAGSLLAAPALAFELPPIEAFGRPPAESLPVISPDGHWLAWLDQHDAQAEIVLFDVPRHQVHRVLNAPPAVVGLVWADEGVLLIRMRGVAVSHAPPYATHEEFGFVALDAQEGPARFLPLVHQGKVQVAVEAHLLLTRSGRPHTVMMALPHYCHCVAAVDTRTGVLAPFGGGKETTVGWLVDRHGQTVVHEDWDYKHHTYRLLVQTDSHDKPREILRESDAHMPSVRGLTANGEAVVLLTSNGRAHQAAWALPLDGSPMQLLVEDPQADVTNVFTDPKTGAIIGVYVSGSVTTLRWLDPAVAKRQEALERLFPGRDVWQAGWTDDIGKVLVQVQGPAAPPVYYLVDYATHRADIAAEEYPALARVTLAPTRETRYAARDGTAIPAYVTTPPDSKGPWPMVILPHDGPASRDYLQFSWLVQFLVSRGYAVLQPQYRGSSGFGDAWLKAGFRQWGGLMQDDVNDGVSAMAQAGIADPQRVCIAGFEYGGYVAMAGVAFAPALYRCAVSLGGVADIAALVREARPKYGAIAANELIIKERIGAAGDAALVNRSPINAVKDIRAPLLLLYGTGDPPAVAQQSERMAAAMREAGKPVRLETFRTNMEMLREMEDFLKEHL